MKKTFGSLLLLSFLCTGAVLHAQDTTPKTSRLFMDVHYLKPGSVSFADVAAAHQKDLAAQDKYGVHFLKFWVDEKRGAVYCLSSATDSAHIADTHRDAHGLLPQEVYAVTDGKAAVPQQGLSYFLDVHNLGAGNVTAEAVARAHEKDLAVQGKHGVRFLNYWVNEAKGMVYCLSQAKDSANVVQTHKEAHGLLPAFIAAVKEGQ